MSIYFKKTASLAVAAVFLLAACASLNVQMPKTPQERLYLAQSLYNQQYDDYQYWAARPDLSYSMKKLLRQKKQVLINAEKAIKTYRAFVQASIKPTSEAEGTLMQIINELKKMAAR